MLQRHLTILGNDQPTLQLSLAAVRSGHPVRCVYPEVRHSAWLIGQRCVDCCCGCWQIRRHPDELSTVPVVACLCCVPCSDEPWQTR